MYYSQTDLVSALALPTAEGINMFCPYEEGKSWTMFKIALSSEKC